MHGIKSSSILVITSTVLLVIAIFFFRSLGQRRVDPVISITFLGHFNDPDGTGLSRFAVSNASTVRVARRACFETYDSQDVPDDPLGGRQTVLSPHQTEVIDVEDRDPTTNPFPPGASPNRWRLKVACVAVRSETYYLFQGLAHWARRRGMPAPRMNDDGEVWFLSGWLMVGRNGQPRQPEGPVANPDVPSANR